MLYLLRRIFPGHDTGAKLFNYTKESDCYDETCDDTRKRYNDNFVKLPERLVLFVKETRVNSTDDLFLEDTISFSLGVASCNQVAFSSAFFRLRKEILGTMFTITKVSKPCAREWLIIHFDLASDRPFNDFAVYQQIISAVHSSSG